MRVVSVRFLARFVTVFIVRRAALTVVGPRYQACPLVLVRRHNRCAGGPRKRPILVLPARYPRVCPGLASWIKRRKGPGMEFDVLRDLLVDEPADGDEVLPLLVGELLADGEEVRAERLPEMRADDLCHLGLLSAVRNASTIGAMRSASVASAFT